MFAEVDFLNLICWNLEPLVQLRVGYKESGKENLADNSKIKMAIIG